ncbi:MAG: hypothetical protein R3Y43_01605 [Alphaproteobacteria bacterium]
MKIEESILKNTCWELVEETPDLLIVKTEVEKYPLIRLNQFLIRFSEYKTVLVFCGDFQVFVCGEAGLLKSLLDSYGGFVCNYNYFDCWDSFSTYGSPWKSQTGIKWHVEGYLARNK